MAETRTNATLDALKNVQNASNEFFIMERVVHIVSTVYSTKPDFAYLASELSQVINFDIFGIVLLQHDQKAIRVTTCQRSTPTANDGQWIAQYHRHPFSDSMVERLLPEHTLLLNEYPDGLHGSHAECGDALSSYPQLHSTCIVPLRAKERLLGTLELGSSSSQSYSNALVQRVIVSMAQVLAAAIERTQLEGSADIQDRQREALKDVSRALTSTMDLATILSHITDGVSKAINVSSLILTFDPHQGNVRLMAQHGLDQTVLDALIKEHSLLSKHSIVGDSLEKLQTVVSSDVEKDERFPSSISLYTTLHIHSVLVSPLLVDSTVYGVLMLCSNEIGGFSPLKLDIVALFATQATLAIHNSTLLESARQRNRFQDAVEQLDQAIASHNVSKAQEFALLAHVHEETQRTFGISFSSVVQFISDNLLTKHEHDTKLVPSSLATLAQKQVHPRDLEPSLVQIQTEKETAFTPGDPLHILTQSSQAVLARTGIVSELSALLMQMQQPTNGIKDAWLVTSVEGKCIYMNPVAEALCHIRQSDIEKNPMVLELVFSILFPFIRNVEEVLLYLQNFAQNTLYKQEVRCIIALEPLVKQDNFYARLPLNAGTSKREGQEFRRSTSALRTMSLDHAPSDTYYLLSRHPLLNSQGQRTAYALQVRDITMQVRDEKNKATLLSSVSHELRTPLTTIKAAVTGLLQPGVPWDEQMKREMLEDINIETDHLTMLVSSLVEMSRIEMGALILEKEWCDISEVIYSTLLKTKHFTTSSTITTQFEGDIPLLFLDRVQIERVLYNLVENAVRYSSGKGTVLLSIDCIAEESGHEMVRVRIIDEGDGIPTGEQERIFKAFYSLQATGNGMGLAICKGIIEMHHGHIKVEPRQRGSCFTFTLPVEQTA